MSCINNNLFPLYFNKFQHFEHIEHIECSFNIQNTNKFCHLFLVYLKMKSEENAFIV
jgi:hypothetical protein